MKIGLREIIFAVLLIAIPVAAWAVVLRPNNAYNRAMLADIESKQHKLSELNMATGLMGDLEKQIDNLEETIKYFQSKLPSEKDIDKVLSDVWLLARQNNLSPKVIKAPDRKPQAADAELPNAEQPIQLELEGDFYGFYSFLQALENQPRIMRIAEMTLEHDPEAPQGVVRAQIGMSIFFERAKPVAMAANTKGT